MKVTGQLYSLNPNVSSITQKTALLKGVKPSQIWRALLPHLLGNVMNQKKFGDSIKAIMVPAALGTSIAVGVILLLERIDAMVGAPTSQGGIIGLSIEKYFPEILLDKSLIIAQRALTAPMNSVRNIFNRVVLRISGIGGPNHTQILGFNALDIRERILTTAVSPVVEETLTQSMNLFISRILIISLISLKRVLAISKMVSANSPDSLRMIKIISKTLAIIESALIFASAHEAGADSRRFMEIFIPGLVYATVFMTRGLLAAITTHSMYNLVGTSIIKALR